MSDLVLLSGGLDSTVALAQAVKLHGHENVAAISFDYGQRHSKELECAIYQANKYGVRHRIPEIDVYMGCNRDLFSNCAMLKGGAPVPEGEYNNKEIPSTYVPFRNGLMLSIATAVAYESKFDNVVISAHKNDDAAAYPDCSPAFLVHMGQAIAAGTGHKVQLWSPFANFTKADIVKCGIELDVEFSRTWSCYEGGPEPCGKCATCIDRQKAFEANGFLPF